MLLLPELAVNVLTVPKAFIRVCATCVCCNVFANSPTPPQMVANWILLLPRDLFVLKCIGGGCQRTSIGRLTIQSHEVL